MEEQDTCVTDNLPRECAVNFRILEVKLNNIRNNDLAHIEKDIDGLSNWVRALMIVFASGFLGIILSLIFGQ